MDRRDAARAGGNENLFFDSTETRTNTAMHRHEPKTALYDGHVQTYLYDPTETWTKKAAISRAGGGYCP